MVGGKGGLWTKNGSIARDSGIYSGHIWRYGSRHYFGEVDKNNCACKMR